MRQNRIQVAKRRLCSVKLNVQLLMAYYPSVYFRRSRYMAECSGRVIAVYDEREKCSIPDACRAEIRVGEQTTEKSGKEINDTKLAKETL